MNRPGTGTGLVATPPQAEDVHDFIRRLLVEIYGCAAADVRILYGGSVTKDITELIAMEDIDGALVGGASLKADGFPALFPKCHRKVRGYGLGQEEVVKG